MGDSKWKTGLDPVFPSAVQFLSDLYHECLVDLLAKEFTAHQEIKLFKSERKVLAARHLFEYGSSMKTASQVPLEQVIYERALKDGAITVERLRLMFVGQDGSGKTSLIRSLLRKPFDEKIPSTDGVVITNAEKWQDQEDSGGHFLDECLKLGIHVVKTSKPKNSLKRRREEEPMNTLASREAEEMPQEESEALDTRFPDLSEISQEQMDSLVKFIRMADEHLSEIENLQIQHLWDLGGQETYLSTHCLLLPSSHLESSLTAFVLVINLAALLTDPAAVSRFRLPNGPLLECTKDHGWIKNNEDFVRAWLSNFINAFPEPVDSQPGLGQTEDVKDPPIFIAGTHFDVEEAKDILEKQREIVASIMEGTRYQDHVVLVGDSETDRLFLIDNTKSDSCSGVQNLRQRINRMSEKSQKSQPFRWILLELAIAKLKKEIPILTPKYLNQIAVVVCGLSDEREVKLALDHLDNLGIIFRFPRMPDKVFINPEWLVQTLAIFVTAKNPGPRLTSAWEEVQKTGNMSKSLVDARLDDAKVPQEKRGIVLDLLRHLDIAIPVPLQVGAPSEKPDSGDLFVPCLLTNKCDVSSTLWQKMDPSTPFPPPLVLLPLRVGAVPEALFFRLVTRFLGKYKRLTDGVGRHRCLFTTSSDILNFELLYNCQGKAVILTVGGNPDYLKGSSWICEVTELRKYFEREVEDVRNPGMGEFKYEIRYYLEEAEQTTEVRAVVKGLLYKLGRNQVLRNDSGDHAPIELADKVLDLWIGRKTSDSKTLPPVSPDDPSDASVRRTLQSQGKSLDQNLSNQSSRLDEEASVSIPAGDSRVTTFTSRPARLDGADVCIVTVVDIEREQTRQVLEYVTKKKTEQMRIFDDNGRVKRECRAVDWTFMGDKGPLTLKVALFQQAKMGSSEASQLVNDIAQLKPALVAMVGVCAGAENKVKAGDLLAPLELQIVSGKVRENGEMDREPTIAQLRSRMKVLVSGAAANMDPYAWKEFLPDQWRDRPLRAPSNFQDKILCCLKDEDKGMTAKDMTKLKGFENVKTEWVTEAVEKLLDEGHLQKEGKRQGKDIVRVSDKGRTYIMENIDEDELNATRNPKVLTGPVLTIDVVSENLEFGDLRKAAANRKLVGAEMEGNSFLFSADNMQYENAVFIKAVSDFGSKRSQMDYYQPYCASSAAAFLCYLINRNPQLFPK